MSYNKLGFISGQTLMAEHLNHMEEGIANAGGVKSWNDLTDKPFGETVTEGILEFDGNLEGREYYTDGDKYFVKMTDDVFTNDDITMVGYAISYPDKEDYSHYFYYANEELMDDGSVGALTVSTNEEGIVCVVVLTDGFESTNFPQLPKGVYYACKLGEWHFRYMSCVTGEIKKAVPINLKYLPEHLQFGEISPEPIIFDGNYDGKVSFEHPLRSTVGEMEVTWLLVKVSDNLYTAEQLSSATRITQTRTIDGKLDENVITGKQLDFEDQDGFVVDSSFSIVCFHKIVTLDILGEFITPPSTGLYFMYQYVPDYMGKEMYNYISKIEFQSTIKTIDEKYLPDSVKGGGGSFVLRITADELVKDDESLYMCTTQADDLAKALEAGSFVSIILGKDWDQNAEPCMVAVIGWMCAEGMLGVMVYTPNYRYPTTIAFTNFTYVPQL